jgi:hypothetical protein
LTTRKYADFRKNYAVGLAQLSGALGPSRQPIMPPSGQALPHRDDEVFALLTKIQARTSTLASCLSEMLALATRRGDLAVKKFCERELSGFPQAKIAKNDPDYPTHRLIKTYVSPLAEINTQYFGFQNASAVMEYLANDKDCIPMSMLVSESVGKLESMPTPDTDRSVIHVRGRWGDLDPNSKTPDAPLHIYSRADSHADVLEAIREASVRRLLAMLPAAPSK